MATRKLIAPSILSSDFARLAEEVGALGAAGADWLHVDVMDGHFVPNLTIGPPVIKALRQVTALPLDVHLMIDNPERFLEAYVEAGADYLTVHVETCPQPDQILAKIRALGAKPGITLRPDTPLSAIEPFFPLVDLVLIMTVYPGFSGQSFLSEQAERVGRTRAALDKMGSPALVEVDGGIDPVTVRQCSAADVFVSGKYVFSGDYSTTIEELRTAAGR